MEKIKTILGFNFKDYEIELSKGWVEATKPISVLHSKKDIFKEVYWNGDEKDFRKLIQNLKRLEDSEFSDWASYVLTAQQKWNEKDQEIFDIFYKKENEMEMLQKSTNILWLESGEILKRNRRKKRLIDRETGLKKIRDSEINIDRDSIFITMFSKMISLYIDLKLKGTEKEKIFRTYQNLNVKEIKSSRIGEKITS
ncbi:MAG: hypothetical protein CL760_01540 [Chloroflexi bacterium]|nr:hypothetical protein [Chloroflexota bacterium]|tara:strand:- start:66623 stop:67213 length:591 start_codon:yes stop_codon:yes gene_type:complete